MHDESERKNARRDDGGVRFASRTALTALALAGLVAASVPSGAQESTAGAKAPAEIDLWLSDAPLTRVLEHVAGNEGIRVVVDESIDGVVDGRLEGDRETVLANLVVEHGLVVHGDEDTVWFDRADRPVVEFVELPPGMAMRALDTLDTSAALDEGGPAREGDIVERSAQGLMLSGSRAFVASALDRLAALPQVPAADTGRDITSVTDIPGYDVDYTEEELPL